MTVKPGRGRGPTGRYQSKRKPEGSSGSPSGGLLEDRLRLGAVLARIGVGHPRRAWRNERHR